LSVFSEVDRTGDSGTACSSSGSAALGSAVFRRGFAQLGLATVGAGGAFVDWQPGSLQCLLVGYGFLVSPSAIRDSSA
jgi:hypothetical protein